MTSVTVDGTKGCDWEGGIEGRGWEGRLPFGLVGKAELSRRRGSVRHQMMKRGSVRHQMSEGGAATDVFQVRTSLACPHEDNETVWLV